MSNLHEILPVTKEIVDQYQILPSETSVEILDQIALASTFRVLKSVSALKVMELGEGQKFVTRDYSRRDIDFLNRKNGVDFAESWAIMHEMYGRAGINIVPSFAIDHRDASKDKGLTVVSEYLQTATPLSEADTKPKQELAYKLGKLMHDPRRYSPALETLRPDMFHATNTTERASILLTDVDPFVVNSLMLSRVGPVEQFKDESQSNYITKVGDLIWDH